MDVTAILSRRYALDGNLKQKLIFDVWSVVPYGWVQREDMFKATAQLIVELQSRLPVPGTPVGGLPRRVDEDYLAKVTSFLGSHDGQRWMESIFEPDAVPGAGVMRETERVNPIRQMDDRGDQLHLDMSLGTDTMSLRRAGNLNTTVGKQMSAISMSDRASNLVPENHCEYGTVSVNAKKAVLGEDVGEVFSTRAVVGGFTALVFLTVLSFWFHSSK